MQNIRDQPIPTAEAANREHLNINGSIGNWELHEDLQLSFELIFNCIVFLNSSFYILA